ncbi:MAG: hypothetical protein FWH41_09575, partial [Treponema sp.]|nr:hypothetical protein [Treponema sp.]
MQKIFRAGMPRLLAVLALIFLIPPVVFGGGRKQKIQTQTAEGAGIWQTEFDVSSLKKGTYNFIVNAKDAAGNVGVSGPFNIRIDPNAGLPETRIVYPEEGMVMRNDFNIVGVAAARYGLKQVLIKIDNGEFLPMEGLDYWHYPFSFEEFSEGKHTIYAKAIDLNDMEGPVFKTEFYFDIVPPEFELTSHQIGDLIAGTVKIKGTVYDSLGIKSLHISDDNVHFTKLRHSSIRNDPARQFQFTIPSKKHTDGAMVYYLRAVNNTGFSVTKPFLFFVNNHPPEIEILSPEPDENSFGMTQVTGKVISGVGLTEFYYEWGGERFDITLRPGDPFWTAHVHFSLTNNRPVPFKITAVDKSGNVSSVTHRLKDTRRNRTPAFEIDYPLPNVGTINLEYDQPLYGHILPGFFPQSIMIEGAIDLVEAQPGFRIPPSLLPAGRSTVRMWAIAEDGTTSDQGISVRVNRAPPPSGFEWQESPITVFSPDKYYKEGGIAQVPVYDSDFNIIGFEEGTSTEEFAPWYADSFDLNGMIDGYRGNQKLEYRLRWDDTWKPISVDSSGEFNTTVSIAHLPDGPVPMELRTITDGSPQYPLFWPVNKYSEQPSVTFLTPNKTFGPVSRSSTTSGWVDYTVPLEEISFSTDGEYFEPTEFTAKYGRAWFNGLFDFPAIKQANRELVIRVTDRAGNVVEASPDYEFDNSNSAPVVFLNTPTGELITGDFDISGLAYVDVGIDAVYWRILSPRNPWDSYETTFARRNNTEYEKMEVDQNFHVQLSLDDVKDGINILEIFAEDIYGMQSKEVIRRPFNVSTAQPDVTFVSPSMDIWNRGNITVNGTAFDLNGLSEVLVSMD